MNSLRTEAIFAKLKWRRCFGLSLVLLAGIPLYAAPSKVIPKGSAVQSDVMPIEIGQSAPDLQLSPEEVHRGDAMAMFISALIDEDNSETDKAFDEYQKTLSLDPSYTDLALRVAGELARRGDVTAGINILKESIKAAPKQPLPYLGLSQLYSKYLHKPEPAIKYAALALELNPNDLTPYLALYDLYSSSNHAKNAGQILDRAIKQDNSTPDYWFQLGEFLSGHLIKSVGSPDDLKRLNVIFQKSLSLAGDDPVIITKIADNYLWLKQPSEAIPLYSKVIGLKNDPADPGMLAIRDKLARALLLNGQFDEAMVILKQLIKEYPLRVESYELLGEIYEQKNDFQNALANYRQTLLLDSTRPGNYLRVADLYLKLKEFDKSIALLNEAHQKFRELPLVTYSLAVAQSRAARPKEALVTFAETLRDAENIAPEMLNGAFYFAYGSTADQGGQTDLAVELLRKSIEIDPSNSAPACNYLGYLWVDRGERLEEAARLINRALELDPGNPAYLDSLGWYYFKSAHYDKALVELKKAADGIRPEDPTICEHLGDTYSKLQNNAEALVYWQKAANLDPANQSVLTKIENSKQKMSANPPPAVK